MADILNLVPRCGTRATLQSIAQELRDLADLIEAGDYGELDNGVILLADHAGQVSYNFVGSGMTSLEAIGLFQVASSHMIYGEDE